MGTFWSALRNSRWPNMQRQIIRENLLSFQRPVSATKERTRNSKRKRAQQNRNSSNESDDSFSTSSSSSDYGEDGADRRSKKKRSKRRSKKRPKLVGEQKKQADKARCKKSMAKLRKSRKRAENQNGEMIRAMREDVKILKKNSQKAAVLLQQALTEIRILRDAYQSKRRKK